MKSENFFPAEKTHTGKYLIRSNQSVYQLLFLLPLLLIYEIAAVLVNFNAPFEMRNGADILLKYTFYSLGIESVFSFVMVTLLFVVLMLIVAMKKYQKRIRFSYFAGMFSESLVYAFIIGIVSSKIAVAVTSANPFLATSVSDGGMPNTIMHQLMIGIGAGVYEEIVFRALLITLLLAVINRVKYLKEHKMVIAVFISAILFSAFHYVGEFGEIFNVITFSYRLVAGLLLSALFILRGIGVCAWSHAIYDVYVVFGVL